jgi:hypothetical protein
MFMAYRRITFYTSICISCAVIFPWAKKKQYDFFGFGEEIGLEFFAGDNLFDKACKDKRSACFFFEIKLNLCVFKKNNV